MSNPTAGAYVSDRYGTRHERDTRAELVALSDDELMDEVRRALREEDS